MEKIEPPAIKAFKALFSEEPIAVALFGGAAFKAALESYGENPPQAVRDFVDRVDAEFSSLQTVVDALGLEDD